MRKIIWRLGSLIMVMVLLLSVLPMTVRAVDGEWIEISSAAGLVSVGSNLSGNYRLTADIDLAGAEWNPIGPFSGKLDGNSKVIRNFTINDTSASNKGLFSSVAASGQISNLGIENAIITAGSNAGILAGTNSGAIIRSYTKGSVSGYEYIGGFVGQNSGTIENSFAQASVSGKDFLGGLAGANSGTVINSYAASSLLASVFNNYLEFNGTPVGNYSAANSGGYIDIPHKDTYVGDSFTLEAWFQWDDVGTADTNFIMGKGVEQFEIHTGGGSGINGLRFIPVWNEGGDSWIDIKNVIQPGWFHVAAVYEYDNSLKQATAMFYVNGEPQDLWREDTNLGKTATLLREFNTLGYDKINSALPADESNLEPKGSNINIGRRTDGWFYFDGKICDVRFWNIARTGEDIKRDKDRVLNGNETGLAGYWKLNEESGIVAIDSSTTLNNGTLKGDVVRIRETAATHKGGLIGQNTGTVSGSCYDSEVSGQSDAIGTSKSTADMKLQSTFTDWDFTNIWGLNSEIYSGYPYLLSEIRAASVTMTSPAAGAIPQTAAQVETATGSEDYTVSNVVWNGELTPQGKFKADQVYTVNVTLTSKNGNVFPTEAFTPVAAGSASVGSTATNGTGVGNTVTFTVTFSATAAKTVTGIQIKNQPADLIYTKGESLNLAGLEVTLTYNDGSAADVTAADFAANGITASPANGTVLTVAVHNGSPVTLTCNGYNAITSNLTVEAVLTYTIAAIGNQTMIAKTAGYVSGAQETKTITVTRTGTGDLPNLAVSLSGGGSSKFIIGQPLVTTLNTGTPSTTFTVKAKDGLAAGTYTETVTVSADNMTDVTFTVTQVINTPPDTQAMPGFSPAGGTIAFGSTVTITSAGADHIYYTIDGSNPATSAGGYTLEYTEPVTVNTAMTIKAIAVKAGNLDSAIGSASYTQAASADLTDIVLSGSPSNYAFAGDTYTYNGVTVANGVSGITVTPAGAGTITVDGTPVTGGQASGAIALIAGAEKTITVVAAEAGKSAKTYIIKVTREMLDAPSVPVIHSAVSGDAHVTLTWDSVPGAAAYKIFSTTTAGLYATALETVGSSVYSYDATGLTNGTTYYFVVKATNGGGDSDSSNEVSATPQVAVPGAPILQSASAGDGYVKISWSGVAGSTGYKVYASTTSGSYTTPPVTTAAGLVYSCDVTGLTNGTTYYFVVKATNGGGDSDNSNEVSATPQVAAPGTPIDPIEPSKSDETEVEILVNGKTETAATATTIKVDGKIVTTIAVDDKKVEEKLQQEGNNAVVTIPVKNNADVIIGTLNGQTVKNMETMEAVVEVKTENVTYTLPASQINIDAVSEQIGKQVELKDIAVSVKISEPTLDTVKIVEDTANKYNYQVVVKPVEFEITCSSGNKTVEVSKFNAYVERLVAIPEGVDPSRITTGIVLNSDGTFSHVPTVITIIDGKYYAKINSLTNSTYLVIWNPKTFKDVDENHWAREAVGDMSSRLVISGVGNDMFEPDSDITRGEFAAIVVKAMGLMRPGTGKASFGDVQKNDWYYDAVSIAYENSIISGYGNGKFGPNDKITREQAMIIIARAMKITKLKVDFKAGEAEQLMAAYGDTGMASSWAMDSIASCIRTGVVSGRGGKLIAPGDNITRSEVAVIVQRLLKKSNLI